MRSYRELASADPYHIPVFAHNSSTRVARYGKLPHTQRMAKSVPVSDELYALAQWEAMLQDRSIAQQLEHWGKLGTKVAGDITEVEIAKAMTRKLDALDVLSGRRSPEYFHFIPRWMVEQSTRVYPPKYQP